MKIWKNYISTIEEKGFDLKQKEEVSSEVLCFPRDFMTLISKKPVKSARLLSMILKKRLKKLMRLFVQQVQVSHGKSEKKVMIHSKCIFRMHLLFLPVWLVFRESAFLAVLQKAKMKKKKRFPSDCRLLRQDSLKKNFLK